MENFKNTLKYWFVVVGWPAIKKAAPISTLKDKMMDILITLVVAVVFVVSYGRINAALPVGFNLTTVAYILAVTFVLRLLVGLIYLPSELHTDQQSKIDELNKELTRIKDNRPNIEPDGEPYEDIRTLGTRNGKVLGNANCFHVNFANKPKNKVEEASAQSVHAKLTYYLHSGDKLIGPIYGRWGDTEQPMDRSPFAPNTDLATIVFESSGFAHGLDLAFYYPDEDVIYAFNNDSYRFLDWKNPAFAINKNSIFIHVQLSGNNIDDKDWWILIDWQLASRKISLVKAPEFAKE